MLYTFCYCHILFSKNLVNGLMNVIGVKIKILKVEKYRDLE